MTFTQKYSRKQIRRERPILTNSCPYGIVESETKYLLISSVVCFAYCWRRSYGAPFICVACNEWKALPHNSSAALAMSFPPSAACKFLDLHPVNLRNLHLHLTKNPFASRPPHLRGVTQTLLLRTGYSIWCALSRKMTNSAFRIAFFVLFSFCPFRFPVLTRGEGYGTLFHVETLRLLRKRVVFEGGFPV